MSSNSRVGVDKEVTSDVRGRGSEAGRERLDFQFELEEEPTAGGDFDVDIW